MADRLVVVGASLAGLRAIEAVRADGWTGSVALIGAEEHLPYDRPPLSKDYLAADECADPTYREERKLTEELGAELLLGSPASALDVHECTVSVGERVVPYDALVIATGSHARELPGTRGLGGVFTIRTLDDAKALRVALRRGKPKVTVVGGGFIGSELAAVGRTLGLPVTVVERHATPLAGAVGEEMGQALTRLHERNGTRVLVDAQVEEVVGDDHVRAVKLADGTEIETDILVAGVGAAPSTGWLENSALTVDDGVVADARLAAAPRVHVAGDIARWPNALFDDVLRGPMRLQHWTSASEQGSRAALNAVSPDRARAYETVPYFWSDWYSSRIQFTGIPASDTHAVDVEVVAGDHTEGGPFTALYRANDRIIGALAVDMRAEVMKYRRLIAARTPWADAMEFARTRRRKAAARRSA
ncbi:NAD(P)/FAD-dependent oxidoreductase [Amycolatopsis sp. YIM 10]|uniref:NAD(P)/FAD-dependent oxidoreductase n=1 Tax=Amycolatopsis sp. YIM 10 TaxID=2653857 RepID=UPI0012905222|nr:FAD-dependent oxidoreductase [Amycolatopsis sp. YIM 10]QFU91994.1 Anthranilate 1,2-dioxygenase system ferredoxin--NAD(+) reductase component [Amycolatopsis sp. YIM 10]